MSCCCKRSFICPLRPQSDSEGIAPLDSWDSLEDADVLVDPESRDNIAPDIDEEVDLDSGVAVQIPRGLPSPPQPSKEEKARHDLTHINYRSWCPHCVFGRRNNTPHNTSQSSRRNIPLFCADYCFLRDIDDPDNVPCLVGRLYPSKAIFASICDKKGADDPVVKRLANFIKESGLSKMVYKTDQESALRSTIEEALRRTGRSGVFESFEAVPELSAVGESASNGKAERAVQTFEDHLRTLKSALDSRLKQKVPVDHPLMAWLVEHTANVINRYAVTTDGTTPYQALHGKRSTLKVVEFAEQVFFYVPKKLRAKLSRRWQLGTYLGLVNSSNEHMVATRLGNVVKSRSVVRVVEASRWNSDAALATLGTPTLLNPLDPEDDAGYAAVDESEQPHLELDAGIHDGEPMAEPNAGRSISFAPGKIMARDLERYGYTDECPRCTDIQRGNLRSFRNHTDQCKMRIYFAWKEHDDPKYLKVKHLLEPSADEPTAADDLDVVALELGPDVVPNAAPQFPSPSTPVGPPPPSPPPIVADDGIDGPEHPGLAPEDENDVADIFMDSPDDAADNMVDYLVLSGADPNEARDRVNVMLGKPSTTFIEMYGRGSINLEANNSRRQLGLRGIGALDLRTTKPDGTPWDFTKRSDRRTARDLISAEDPDWIIGSPPCTAFSQWNIGINHRKMPKEKVDAAIAEGRIHLSFMASLYRRQIINGKHFLHEHPAGAASWKEPSIAALMKLPSVCSVVAHQCMFGLLTPSGDGTALAMKPTRFMSNSPQMIQCLSRTCDRSHTHQPLTGGRCAAAAFYPLPLVRAILEGMRSTTEHLKRTKDRDSDHRALVSAVMDAAGTIPTETDPETILGSSIKRSSGGVLPIGYAPEQFRPRYVDEYTGQVLNPELARSAIIEELDYFNSRVWEISTKEEMEAVPGYIYVRSRWVCCNKGDDLMPDVRCRLVACEINKGGDRPDHFFASTPPLEAKKLLFARFAQERMRSGHHLQLSFVDVRKAYFNGIPRRPVFMQFPKELGLPNNLVAKLVRCAYGTRDAGAIWEDAYRGALESLGFVSGISSPCVFYHPSREIHTVVHGDDFTSMGVKSELDWLETEFAKHFELKIRGRLGEDCSGPQEIRILNRIVTLGADGLTYEADPRHVDLLSSSLGLTSANSVATPGVKDPNPDYDSQKENEPENLPLESTGQHGTRIVAGITSDMVTGTSKTVTFSDDVSFSNVTAYSTVYGIHPRFIAATSDGWKTVSSHADPFTCKSGAVMQQRHAKLYEPVSRRLAASHRQSILKRYISSLRANLRMVDCDSNLTFHDALLNSCLFCVPSDGSSDPLLVRPSADVGAYADSEPTDGTIEPLPLDPKFRDIVCATRTPPSSKKSKIKRAGAKTVKAMEKLSTAYVLSSDDATTYRALSARGNFLAQDRPDIGYGTKELCREFSVPNRNSQQRLKRVGRYLAGKPRLVYKYLWGSGVSAEDCIDVFVDTDFAGCKESRRSTSGGVIMLDGRCVKHWSKTQSTIALSSGEAELHGIAAGISHGLGLQSLARDLGITLGIRVHTDATAALGICRRRGLGKIRHLDTTDLWCQEKVRAGAVTLHKVPGVDNPADIMTKYVERATLEKMLGILNLIPLDGRAACAPAAATSPN